MKKILLTLLFLLISHSSFAQTTSFKLAWDQGLATGHTYTDVQGYVYTLKVDTAAPILVAATCVNGTPIKCTTPLSLPSGPHTLVLIVTNGFGTASSTPLNGVPPIAAVSVSVTVTVVIP